MTRGRWGRAATARPEWVKSPLLIACADLELDEVVFVFDPLFRYYTEAGQRIARTHYDQSSCGEHPKGAWSEPIRQHLTDEAHPDHAMCKHTTHPADLARDVLVDMAT